MHNRTLKTYIMRAYFVGPNQIVGGPPWLDSDRFDINAKADQPIDDDEALMAMLRTLLAQRCKLVIHHEDKPTNVYVLEVAKSGPKLETAESRDSNSTTNSGHGRIEARVISMKRFAEVLSRQMDLPVVDRTGLDGSFNLKLKWSPRRRSSRETWAAPRHGYWTFDLHSPPTTRAAAADAENSRGRTCDRPRGDAVGELDSEALRGAVRVLT